MVLSKYYGGNNNLLLLYNKVPTLEASRDIGLVLRFKGMAKLHARIPVYVPLALASLLQLVLLPLSKTERETVVNITQGPQKEKRMLKDLW
jgi:hypothetical protein